MKEDASSTVALDELERLTIQRVFDKVHGDKAKACELLGISRATLYRKLKRYQISEHQRGDKILVWRRLLQKFSRAVTPSAGSSHRS